MSPQRISLGFHPRIGLRIALGFAALLGAVAVLAIGGGLVLRETTNAFDDFTDLSRQTFLIVDIERRVTDLQRRALAYTYSGYDGIPQRVETLSAELRQEISQAQRMVDDAEESRLLRRMDEVFSLYDANFLLAVTERHDRDRWLRQGIEPISEQLRAALEQLRTAAIAQGDLELAVQLGAALEQVLLAHQQALAFEGNPDSSLTRAAQLHLEKLAEALDYCKLRCSGQLAKNQLKLIEGLLEQYRAALLGMVQATRGYLYLVYVVLAGEAAELAELARMLKDRNLTQQSRAREAIAAKNRLARRLGLTVAISAILAGALLAWLIGRGITRPLSAVTQSLTELSDGNLNAPIPYRQRSDEIGAIARATDIFRQTVDSKEKAEAANRAKSQFLAHMSHELRTPLNAVLGFSQIMDQMPDTPHEHRRYLSIINRSGAHLLAMINDILDMSKIESGGFRLDLAPCDLLQLLRDVESMFALRAEQQGVTFSLHCDDHLPAVVRTDAGKLRQVLINLLGNAVKFTHAGSIALEVRSLPPAADPGRPAQTDGMRRLSFSIADTGCGIPPDRLDAIFSPFVQASADTAGGTGLGLAICQRLVKLFGGEIEVSSRPGAGSRFQFWIPCEPASAKDLELPEERRLIVGLEAGQPRYRVLIAEDNPTNRHLLRTILAPLHFELREAASGQECLEVFADWHPDLILMDIRMPVMSGREATRRIRRLDGGQQCRIIAVTASSFDDERTRILAEGFDDFLGKPFHPEAIYRLLKQHLRLRYRYADGAVTELPAQPLTGSIDSAMLSAEQAKQLREAVIHGNPEHIQQLIHSLDQDYPAIAKQLREWVSSYHYEHILHWLDERYIDDEHRDQYA